MWFNCFDHHFVTKKQWMLESSPNYWVDYLGKWSKWRLSDNLSYWMSSCFCKGKATQLNKISTVHLKREISTVLIIPNKKCIWEVYIVFAVIVIYSNSFSFTSQSAVVSSSWISVSHDVLYELPRYAANFVGYRSTMFSLGDGSWRFQCW